MHPVHSHWGKTQKRTSSVPSPPPGRTPVKRAPTRRPKRRSKQVIVNDAAAAAAAREVVVVHPVLRPLWVCRVKARDGPRGGRARLHLHDLCDVVHLVGGEEHLPGGI